MGKTLIENRRAKFDYHIIETLEVGIQLFGSEVKSILNGNVSINEAFVDVYGNELFLINSHVQKWEYSREYQEEKRRRKLLAHKSEINKLMGTLKRDGLTIIPLKLYYSDKRKIKLLIGIAKGKKLVDKREAIKERDFQREKRRDFKNEY